MVCRFHTNYHMDKQQCLFDKIEYSKNNGKTWTILAENVDSGSGSGNYQTTVPDLITEQCLIRVSDMKDATVKI